MIFIIGMILYLLGVGVMLSLGTGLRFIHNTADVIGSLVVMGGLIMMLASLATMAWRYLP